MAKRKRLTPARPNFFSAELDGTPPAPEAPRAPISQVAGDVAMTAAFEEVQAELQNAQREGRMVLSLPLDAIREDYLIRDRMACDLDEMEALKDSIRTRGQQTPIEVTDLGDGVYGLISGWRRLRALKELHVETGGLLRFSVVQALQRLPADRPAAYVAMVEENEVRADLSFYERARIVLSAVNAGVFDSDKQALQTLFASASFSKRSKVKSFMPLVQGLDQVLRYPAQIPERLGLALSKAMAHDPAFVRQLRRALHPDHDMTPEQERAALERALSGGIPAQAKPKKPEPKAGDRVTVDPTTPQMSQPFEVISGVHLRARAGRVELDGDGVSPALIDRLKEWLKTQG